MARVLLSLMGSLGQLFWIVISRMSYCDTIILLQR